MTPGNSQNAPLLEIENLGGPHFGPVSLILNRKECMLINGPSGSGKSLFLRALADLDLSDGEVRLDSIPRQDFAPNKWRQQVGLLPAESHWWAETVADHFPACDQLLFQDLGFENEVLKWSIARLSSGERQRLAILRLLANRPRVLLLDEPTANLDAQNTLSVEVLIKRYVEEVSAGVLWVSHDTSQTERIADRIAYFKGGRLEVS